MKNQFYWVQPSEDCLLDQPAFGARIDDTAETVFIPPMLFGIICQRAVTDAPNSSHFLSIVEGFLTEVASRLGETPEEALAAADALRKAMTAHGLALPNSPKLFARGARMPPPPSPATP